MKKGLLLLVTLILVGCNNGQTSFFTTNKDSSHKDQRQEIEQIVKDDQHIKRVTALLTDNAAIVVIEVKPFSKWKKRQYEKEWQKEIEKALPQKDVLVSTDLKIMIETDKLAKKQMGEKELDKKIKELKELSEEET